MAKTKDPFRTFKELFEKQFKTAFDSFDVNLKKAMGGINIPTPKDFQKLEKRVSDLEKRISKLEKPKKTAARKTATSRTKSGAKKPAAVTRTTRTTRTAAKK
ncbi:MAG: hypothetical protein GWO07_10385 [Candidatus Dadabacteria bacterium]|nr:hypothetical protein [Candidatus Dadabacteria bacterium]NIS09153.1 hypothetical protein [Candidatus Dadabacteria bacterium]NIY22460.1 hypothetical protein [Candidatus Dadabacteria bacterium]